MSHWSDPRALVGVDPAEEWTGIGRATTFPELAAIVDTCSYLPDDILVKVDRAAMACSLETRAPLLDERLFELAWSLPVEVRLDGRVGKRVLREVLYRKVPRSLVDRPKRGFGVPLATWLRGPLKGWGADLLSQEQLRRDGLFDPSVVQRVWDEHQAGIANHEYRLWDVLMFQAWHSR
jgi:asparagine synthase (glutamine-hydrolysing)